MSKITLKNLSYDTTLPPFLQRLQNVNADLDGRHERALARPKRARNAEDEEDDAPAYVDEDTNHTLSKDEYAALVGRKEGAEEAAQPGGVIDKVKAEAVGEDVREEEKVAAIGGSKKRKLGKVIGGGDDHAQEDEIAKAVRKADVLSGGNARKSEPSKLKKKSKKIKLSFGDDEG